VVGGALAAPSVQAEDRIAAEDATAVLEMAANEPAVQALPEVWSTPSEGALFRLINRDRVENGQQELLFAPDLLEVARQRARDQAGLAALSHHDADGRVAVVDLIKEAGVSYRLVGENLARFGGDEASRVSRAEAALMRSPGHRSNILNDRFQYIAVGAYPDSRGNTVFVQIFIQPA
jgi:uncharacterized protein YkwD